MKRLLPLLILTVVLAAGCSAPEPVSRTPKAKATSLHKSVFIDDLRLEVATIKDTFPASEIVPIRISVTNTGSKTVTLTFPTAQKQDFTAADGSGAEIWRWSAGRTFAQAVTEMKVEPGATYNFFGRIDAGALPPGQYKVSGWLLAQELFEEKITLVITIK